MRKYFSFLIACVATLFTHSVGSAQTVQSVTDSVLWYNYTTDTDSSLFAKNICQKVDSVLYYEFEELNLWDTDSFIWIPNLKTHRTYDSKGKLLFQESWRWNTAEKVWRNNKRYENLFDSSGRQLMASSYTWISFENRWRGSDKVTSAYDGNGNDTLTISYQWDSELEQWYQAYRTHRSFNEDHTLATQDQCSWSQVDNTWSCLHHTQYAYAYDENKKLIQRLQSTYSLNYDRWDPDRKEEYTYDDRGCLGSESLYRWADFQWHGDTRNVYACDEAGQRIASETHYWDGTVMDWKEGSSRYEYAYNYLGQMTLETLYKRESNSDPWVPGQEDAFVFDDAGRLISDVTTLLDSSQLQIWRDDTRYTPQGRLRVKSSYVKDSLSGMYDRYTKLFYYWDGNGNKVLDLCLDPAKLSFIISGENQVTEGQKALYTAPEILNVDYHWEVKNGTLLSGEAQRAVEVKWSETGHGLLQAYVENEQGCKSDTAFKQVQIGILNLDAFRPVALRLYPVPVKDLLHISTDLNIKEVEIVDPNGRSLLRSPLDNKTLNLSGLSEGIYFVLIREMDGGEVHSRKILKL